MTNKRLIFTDDIKKPVKPHKEINPSDIPSEEDIRKSFERIRRLEELGIEYAVLDKEDTDDCEEDIDKLKASILIMQDKEVPEDLRQRILEKNKRYSK